ncbi:MAG TPA: metallophosphoesterase [Gemmatimonadales bacterium]|nr:metallophosphoesterase [Gemmatimonadales bacterium]
MPLPLTRRQLLLGTAGFITAAGLGDGFLVEPTAIEVTRHDVFVPQLPHDLEELRIACVTDLHLHKGLHRAARATLEHLARERPHLVTLIGDMCNWKSDLQYLTAWAREAHGSLATVATLGNWEHDAGIDRSTAEAAYGRAGVELLFNSAARVRVGTGTFTVVGIDDPVLGRPDVAAAVRDADSAAPALWMLHAPGFVDGITRDQFPRPAAILTGHTHGGQVRLPFLTPYTPYGSGRFVAGWYRDTLAPLYVARGIGCVGIPARLFCRPEIAVFTLRAVRE